MASALAVVAPRAAAAQEHPITWTLTDVPSGATAGVPFSVRLRAQIPPGWHLYSTTQPPGGPLPTVITLVGDTTFGQTGALAFPPPDVAQDVNFQIYTETYVDSVTFTIPVTARATGKRTLTFNVFYQTCTDRFCLPPTSDRLKQSVVVAAGAGGMSAPGTPGAIAVAPSGITAAPPIARQRSPLRRPRPGPGRVEPEPPPRRWRSSSGSPP